MRNSNNKSRIRIVVVIAITLVLALSLYIIISNINNRVFMRITYTSMFIGPVGYPDEITYEIYESGKISIYRDLVGIEDQKETAYMKQSDLKTIREFAINSIQNDTFANTHVQASDGAIWKFVYIDSSDNEIMIYSGYTYDVEELEAIQSLIRSYLPLIRKEKRNNLKWENQW